MGVFVVDIFMLERQIKWGILLLLFLGALLWYPAI